MNDVTTTKANELAVDAPMDLFDGRTGFEDIDPSCIKIPYLKLAKDGTDEVKEKSPVWIPGLKTGMFFNPTTKKIYGEEIRIAILHFQHNYVIYEGTGKESKFKGTMTPMEFDQKIKPIGVREKSYVLANGLRYVDTRNFLVAPYDSLDDGRMILSLYSTGIKPSVSLLTQATNVRVNRNGKAETAPLWSSVWTIGSRFFNDPKGDYFQISKVERSGWVSKESASGLKKWFDESKDIAMMDMDEETTAEPAQRDVTPDYQEETGPSAADLAESAAGETKPVKTTQQDIF